MVNFQGLFNIYLQLFVPAKLGRLNHQQSAKSYKDQGNSTNFVE
ncbi:hypothetical protein FDUTEX481_02176 [Tolypothrix sp. PCC 7601]|nr:hypothetical protein FDUTEX481_02176 [Tolypothrix sp. PCC 7601]